MPLSDPYSLESQQIDQRRKYAEMLREQAGQPLQTQMAGNRAIPLSWTQGLAQGLKGYLGGQGVRKAGEEQKALAERMRTARSTDVSEALKLGQGTPAQTIQPDEQGMGMTPMQQPAVPGNLNAAYARLAQSQDQSLQTAGMAGALSEMKPKAPISVAPGASLVDPTTFQPKYTAPAAVKPPEGYTLAPNSVRFGPDNKPIATGPAAPDKDADAWGEPYNMGGAMVQKNSRTGEVRQAVGRAPVTNVQTSVNAPPPSQVFGNEGKLRDDYTNATKPFTGIRDAYNTVSAALAGPITAVSTLAGATKFMKMIDPESVVRESELQMALRASGLLDRFTNLHNTVMKGQVLTPTQAREIQVIAKTLYDTAEKQQGVTDSHYRRLATEYGLSPERVVRPQGSVVRSGQRAAESPAPQGVTPQQWAVMTPEQKALFQ